MAGISVIHLPTYKTDTNCNLICGVNEVFAVKKQHNTNGKLPLPDTIDLGGQIYYPLPTKYTIPGSQISATMKKDENQYGHPNTPD